MTSRRAGGVALAALLFASALTVPGRAAAADTPPGLDTSYGTAGTATVPIPDEVVVRHRAVVLDLFGPQMVGSADGNLAADPAIGNGTSLPARAVFVPGIATDLKHTDGRGLLLAGISDSGNPVVQRLGDTAAFGTNGVATVPVTVADGDVHIDQAGVVVSGLRTTGAGSAVFVAKLDQVGLPVPDWGTSGVATVDLGPGDDTLLGVVGDFVVGTNGGSLRVVRLTSSGSPNLTWGTNGSITLSPSAGATYTSVGLSSTLLVGGVDGTGHGTITTVSPFDGSSATFTLPWTGSVAAFGTVGLADTVPLATVTPAGVKFASIRLTDGGTVLEPVDVPAAGVVEVQGVVGDAAWLLFDNGAYHVAVDRGTAPATVTTSTQVTSNWGTNQQQFVAASVPRPDNSTVILGGGSSGVWLTALRPDGSPDTDFGVHRPPLLGDPIALYRLTGDRYLVVTGTAAGTWLARFDASGQLDTSYGTGGRTAVPGTFDPDAIVVDSDGATTLVGERARFVSAAGVWDSAYGDDPDTLTHGSEHVAAARRTTGGAIEYFIVGTSQMNRNVLTATGTAAGIPEMVTGPGIGAQSVSAMRADGSSTWITPATPGASPGDATSWRVDTLTGATTVRSKVIRAPIVGLVTGALPMASGGTLVRIIAKSGGAAVARLHADGSVDTAFGRGGVMTWPTRFEPVFGRGAGSTATIGFASSTGDAVITRLRTDQPPAPVRSRYVALAAPARLVDTRTTGGAIAPGTTRTVQATGRLGIPANAVAIAANATFISGAGGGYGQLFGPGTQWPGLTGSVVLRPGGGSASSFTVSRIGAAGTIGVRTTRTAQVIVDVYGYWIPAATATSGRWVPETGARRVLDTRLGLRIPAMGGRVVATGRPGAMAVVVNLTVVAPAAAGSLRVMGGTSTTSAAMSYAAGETRASLAVVPVTAGGSIRVVSTASSHVIVDVVGYVTGAGAPSSGSGLFVAVSPSRAMDTRSGGRVSAGTASVTIGGSFGIPSTARGALVSVISVGAAAPGSVSADRWNAGAPMIRVPAAGTPVAGSTAVPLTSGVATLRTTMATHLVVDVLGWFT